MSLFSTLNTGYSGLSASELATSVTGQNISNANNDYYTRQRIVTSASTPLSVSPGSVGTGVTVTSIERIHDEFVYQRLKDSSNQLSYNQYSQQTLEEIAGYFPDLQGSGISQDLSNYFNAWNDVTTNASDASQKVSLVQSAVTLSANISNTRDQLRTLQDSLNDQVKANINEINTLGQQIADLNKSIATAESVSGNNANDLRDQRDNLELNLSKLLDIAVFKGNVSTQNIIDSNATDQGNDYNINIAGNSFVDGPTFRPLVAENVSNQSNYYSVYSVSQDGTKANLTDKISGGKLGAILDIRGRTFDTTSQGGFPSDGVLQDYIDKLDSFANTLITQTNTIYAQSASTSMTTPAQENLDANTILVNTDKHINTGSFDVVMYDNAGTEVGRKTITIDGTTTMDDNSISDSIVKQINAPTDNNHDNNNTNDINSKFTAQYNGSTFSLTPTSSNVSGAYKISIEDNGTNFPGTIGINQFFSGTNAKDIKVNDVYEENPASVQGYKAPIDGNNDVANAMVQLQYDNVNFYGSNNTITQEQLSGYYGAITTEIASDGEQAGNNVDTSNALFQTVQTEFQSISGVSTDQELTNLIKFQAAYGANAKVITTIDQMLTTLLGIKT
ncbi:flagellar hook-associated protein FlgK [Sulfurospirillum sp. 1612]|uniref:flagellar hook-associated protein FlgK n=1 Tax=Sulfurospirillum sp. 1612 TaxID=3094835 RepID=UPI002F94F64E